MRSGVSLNTQESVVRFSQSWRNLCEILWGLIVSEAVQMDLLDRREIEEEKEQNTPIPTGPHFLLLLFCFVLLQILNKNKNP